MAKIVYYGQLRELTGLTEEVSTGKDVRQCLQHIKDKYGREAYREAKHCLITVNGKSILSLENFKTKVGTEDVLRFLPLCGGG